MPSMVEALLGARSLHQREQEARDRKRAALLSLIADVGISAANLGNQVFQAGADRRAARELQEGRLEHQSQERLGSEAFSAREAGLEREHEISLERDVRQPFARGERAAGEEFTRGESGLDRALARELENLRLKREEARLRQSADTITGSMRVGQLESLQRAQAEGQLTPEEVRQATAQIIGQEIPVPEPLRRAENLQGALQLLGSEPIRSRFGLNRGVLNDFSVSTSEDLTEALGHPGHLVRLLAALESRGIDPASIGLDLSSLPPWEETELRSPMLPFSKALGALLSGQEDRARALVDARVELLRRFAARARGELPFGPIPREAIDRRFEELIERAFPRR